MPPKRDPPRHTEVNAVARKLNEEYATLPFEAVRRSVLRHWPDEEKYRMEVHAKAEQPCVLGIRLVGTQQQYINLVQQRFYPVSTSSFSFFSSDFRNATTGDDQHRTWSDVVQTLNSPETPKVFWICLHCPLGVAPSAERYEELYEKVVLAEGVKDIVGFVHSCDGTLPFGDYISLRHMGATKEEVSALVDFAALRSDASAVEQRITEDGDSDDKWMIAGDEEEKELLEEASKERERVEALLQEVSTRNSDTAAEWGSAAPLVNVPKVQLTPAQVAEQGRRLYRQLNLFGNDPKTSILWRENKAGMHQRLAEQKLSHIRSFEASSAAEAVSRLKETSIAFPVVVKPVSGAGSEFVTLCRDIEDVQKAFALCAGFLTTQRTSASRMVVEDYIDGAEYVVNVVSFEGKHVVTDVWKSWKYPKETTSTRLRVSEEMKLKEKAAEDSTFKMPEAVSTISLLYDRLEFVDDLANLDPNSEPRRVVDYTLAAVTALGMVNGCSHCEVRVDERQGSPTCGKPVLIELNPRMQGDPPRATQLVGYDQYTLLYYLSAVAAAYVKPASTPFPMMIPQTPTTPLAESSLPWPPVPVLYRSRQPRLAPGEEPITRHVVFLTVPEAGVVCSYGVREATALPTFLRVTRSHLFSSPQPNHLTTVSKTVDLYSSPGACVMEGRARDIRKDTARLRELETARVPETALQNFEDAIALHPQIRELSDRKHALWQTRSTINSTRAKLQKEVEALTLDNRASSDVNSTKESGGEKREGQLQLEKQAEAGHSERSKLHLLEAQISQLLDDLAETERQLETTSSWLTEVQRDVRHKISNAVADLEAASTPPLFLTQHEFEVIRDSGRGGLLSLDHVVGTDEEEAANLVISKHPLLLQLNASEASPSHPPTHNILNRFRELFM